jgi:tetratricopeptide (TPR) repeat protein
MEKALKLSSEALEIKCIVGYVHAALGHLDDALRILKEIKLKEESGHEYLPPFYLAILYAGLGDNEECLSNIEKAIEDRSAEIESLIHESMFERVRSDPRFLAMLAKVGLPLPSQGRFLGPGAGKGA